MSHVRTESPEALSIRAHPDVAPLRTHRLESGYRHVYRHWRGGDLWIAAVYVNGRKVRLHTGSYPLPHQAAVHAARWYRERYGSNWASRIGTRMSRKAPWRVWYSEARGGWHVRVWVRGRPVELTGRRKPAGAADPFDTPDNATFAANGRLLLYATRAEGERAAAAWAERRFGAAAREHVWIA